MNFDQTPSPEFGYSPTYCFPSGADTFAYLSVGQGDGDTGSTVGHGATGGPLQQQPGDSYCDRLR